MSEQAHHVPRRHVVLFAYEAWGHTRPLCTLAARLVKSRPVVVTFFTPSPFVNRVDTELSRNFEAVDTSLRSLVRVVGLAVPKDANPLDMKNLNAAFVDAYQRLVREEPVVCAASGIQYGSVPSPDSAIIDFFGYALIEPIRKSSRKEVKVLSWVSCTVAATFVIAGRGSTNDGLCDQIDELTRSGKTFEEATNEVTVPINGTVLQIPGLPNTYDYEHYPQQMPVAVPLSKVSYATTKSMDACDGIVVGSPHCYEPTAISALKDEYAKTSRPVYAFGPLLPSGARAIEGEKLQSESANEIEKFLDATLVSHGPASLVFVSFGTFWWSVEPEKIWAFIDVLMEKNIPFILNCASPLAVIPESVSEKIKAYSFGISSKWSPQQLILGHAATGWFVTHGGHNSVLESLAAAVPMICWPFNADQPCNTIHLTENHKVAYELLEVRNDHGLKPIHRTGKAPSGTMEAVREEARAVLDKAFGEDGMMKRRNAQLLQKEIARAWDEGGSSRLDLEAYLDAIEA